jgi:hypothetical protein
MGWAFAPIVKPQRSNAWVRIRDLMSVSIVL